MTVKVITSSSFGGSRVTSEIPPQTCISYHVVEKKFQIYGVKITGRHICESKTYICSFLLIPQGRWKLVISSERFLKICSPPAERGKDYGADKMSKIKLGTILVTDFDKFHHLCSLCIFAFCFILP